MTRDKEMQLDAMLQLATWAFVGAGALGGIVYLIHLIAGVLKWLIP
ncbi:MAG: hypothetical protein WB868_16325 [Xanthobacteraceae bacterium]